MTGPERAPRLEECWTLTKPDGQSRTLYIEPGSRTDESYLVEQLRSLAGESLHVLGSQLELRWHPAVTR